MIKLTEAAVQVVAADSRAAVAEFDETYIASLRLAANAVEGLRGSEVTAGQTQKLVRTLTASLDKLVQGRGDLVSALGQLQVIHKHSNQAETDAGCPGGWDDGIMAPLFTTGAADVVPMADVMPVRA